MEGVDARANAELIVRAVNSYAESRPLIAECAALLEFCLQNEDLSDSVAREAKLLCLKARRMVG